MVQTTWVGVDCHKDTLCCFKNNEYKVFKTTKSDFKKAVKWAGNNSNWALEGAYCHGRVFSTFLIKNGINTYEVNPMLTNNWRKGFILNKRKNDMIDAEIIEKIAQNCELPMVNLDCSKLKDTLTARALIVKQRTECINLLRSQLNFYEIEVKGRMRSEKTLNELINTDIITIRLFAKQIKTLNEQIDDFEKEIKNNLPEKALKLTEITGIGLIEAAIIYTETKGKLLSKAKLASYCGIAPVEKSSGKTNKKYHNKAGNRKLNSVFFRISLSQSRYDETGKAYFEKKLAEGKTKRQARKCLSRRLVNIIWKYLNEDS